MSHRGSVTGSWYKFWFRSYRIWAGFTAVHADTICKQIVQLKVPFIIFLICSCELCLHYIALKVSLHQNRLAWKWYGRIGLHECSAQTQTGIGLHGKPPAVKQFPSVESHLGVRASYATRRKRRYEANKCGWHNLYFARLAIVGQKAKRVGLFRPTPI